MARFAPLREWERQKENLIAFMEEANRFFIIIITWSCHMRELYNDAIIYVCNIFNGTIL